MRGGGFLRAAGRALLAAALYPAFALVLTPVLGAGTTLVLALALVALVLGVRAGRGGGSPLATAAWVAGGLAFAAAVAGPGLLGGALAVWALGLVLALRRLLRRRGAGTPGDPFARACERIEALLASEPPV